MIYLVIAMLLAAICAVVAYQRYLKPFSRMLERADAEARVKAQEAKASQKSAGERFIDSISALLEKVAPSLPEQLDISREKLLASGIHLTAQAWRAVVVIAISAGAVIGAALAASLAAPVAGLLAGALGGGLVGWMGTRSFLASKTNSRRKKIEQSLPGAIDLLSIMIGAGLPIERAFKELADCGDRVGEISSEFAIVDRDVNRTNVDFCDALAGMSKRCASSDVSAFCSALIQSRKQGSSIKAVLENQADYARKSYFDGVKRRVSKVEVYIVFPLGVFFIPAMILLSMAPLVFQLLEQMAVLG